MTKKVHRSEEIKEIFNDITDKHKKSARQEVLDNIIYNIVSSEGEVGFKKVAFDTRRTDQETERNPRTNLQYWHRSSEFIDNEDQKKVVTFAKLIKPLTTIREKFGNQPEYHNSYSRILLETVERTLKLRDGELDVFKPQLAYVEQLLDARYRLKLEEIDKMGEAELTECLLRKDEDLVKRAMYLLLTGIEKPTVKTSNEPIINYKNGLQTDLGNLILGGDFRRGGEKAVERTITIKIRDEVVE